jgi:hypothetical protein
MKRLFSRGDIKLKHACCIFRDKYDRVQLLEVNPDCFVYETIIITDVTLIIREHLVRRNQDVES